MVSTKEQKSMGLTFGEGGFINKPVKHMRRITENESPPPQPLGASQKQELEVIYENEHSFDNQIRTSVNSIKMGIDTASQLQLDFKENMLLSFYNWPKIESSAVVYPPLETVPSKE